MNLQKIKELCGRRSGGIKRLAESVGMSEANLHRCIRHQKIQAGDLEKIARLLNADISLFFDEDVSTPKSGSADSCDVRHAVLSEKNRYLEAIVMEKEKLLAEKERLITVLMERHGE